MELQLPLLRHVNGRVPSFPRTLAALGELPAFLYGATEFGSSQVRSFFEILSNKEKPRPHIREMILRDQTKRYLERNHFDIEDESLSVGNEPLAALLIRCGPVQFRILKGPGGSVPGCGESWHRRQFYNQKPSSYIDPRSGTIRQTKLNLLLLWDFDSNFNLSQLWLCCPMRAGSTTAEVMTHWHEPLQHPATTINVDSDPSSDFLQKRAEDDLEKLLREDEEESQDTSERA
jgi:hypothetical protein